MSGLAPQDQHSALFAALGGEPGLYVEAAPAGALASRLANEFAHAGWRGVQLAVPDSADADIDTLLVAANAGQAHWLAVRGNAAVRALEQWRGAACRPLVILVESGPLALSAAPWRDTLVHNGYLFAISDEGYHHFVRADQAALHAEVAERASLAWRTRLQASRNALARAQREAEEARSALRMAQARSTASDARATMLQQQIDAIHASTSWQSTKLLRWSGRLRREPGPALRQLRAVGRARAVALLRKVLARVAAKVNDSPGVRRRLAPLAARHPGLVRRMQALLRPGAPLSNAIAPALPPAIDPNNIVGPQFKTLLLDELGRGRAPASQPHQ